MLIKKYTMNLPWEKEGLELGKKIVNHSFISTTFALRHSWSEYVNDINN